MKALFRPLFLLLPALVFFAAGCAQKAMPPALPSTAETSATPETPPVVSTSEQLTLTSSAFVSGAMIPVKYSCDGSDVNPPLSWTQVPAETKSFALIINDPDAVAVVGRVVDHWVLWNIPASAQGIAENSVPHGASQGKSYNARKYQGPCPPSGTTHHYFFRLYALDLANLDLSASTNGKNLETALQGHILQQAELMARYKAR